jgi:hypothetical protein
MSHKSELGLLLVTKHNQEAFLWPLLCPWKLNGVLIVLMVLCADAQ